MKRHSLFLISISSLLLSICIGCGGNNDMMKLITQRDSLIQVNSEQLQTIRSYTNAVNTLNSVFDSIATEEGLIFLTNNGEETNDRKIALQNLERYATVLNSQKRRIHDLQLRLQVDADTTAIDLKDMVSRMQQQLAAKDEEIAYLRAELSKKDVNIAQLRQQIALQQTTLDEQAEQIGNLTQRNIAQVDALRRQDEIINQCYVAIGSKKELERKGIIRKSRIVSETTLDKSKFMKVDIRNFREITFDAKKPRIITNMPQSSYILTTTANKGSFTLKITNPTAFWNASNYLVIQTD